jgi:peptidoglycan-associated lipoprotein
MIRIPLSQAAALALGAVVVSACHHAQAVTASQPTPAAQTQTVVRQTSNDDAARRDAMRADSLRRAEEAARAAAESARQTIVAPVHFDFDRSDIRSDDQGLLDRKASILSANRSMELRIEGNADERGSDEYNLALGMRRAAAARRYLVEHGVDSNRLTTVSNGEEKPVCRDHDESCWSQNRRDEFVITAGGDHIIAQR